MNARNVLKVNVNGTKYLITGIKQSTSCKDLLCALAKATQIQQKFKNKEQKCTQNDQPRTQNERSCTKDERSMKALYSIESIDDNLIETFKSNLENVGDTESLNIFNGLSKSVRITKRDPNEKHKRKTENERKDKKRKERDKTRKDSSRVKTRTKSNKHITKEETKLKKYSPNRSVDDSDLDSYRNEHLNRVKKHRSRVFDDSDLDVYRSLFNIVIDQSKKITNIEKQKRQIKKSEWLKEIYRDSQVYFIDENIQEDIECFEKDIDNDSGLPTPEYDSSESHENQPIKTPDLLHKPIKFENKISRDHIFDDCKQTKLFTEAQYETTLNDVTHENKNNENLQNKCNIIPNENKSFFNNNIEVKVFLEKNKNIIEIADGEKILNVESEGSAEFEQFEQRSHELCMRNKEKEVLEKLDKNINGETITKDCNKNIIFANTLDKDSNTKEEELLNEEGEEKTKTKMVAFEAVLSKKSYDENKKLNKKKINKLDISNPVLLSPSTFKKHKTLLNVQKSLLLTEELLSNEAEEVQCRESSTKDDREKIKIFNKKIKEIKLKRKSKSSTKREEEHANGKEISDKTKLIKTVSTNGNDGVKLKVKSRENVDKSDSSIYKENIDTITNSRVQQNAQDSSNDSFNDDITRQQNKDINSRELEHDRALLLKAYEEEKIALDNIIIQVIEYNLYIAELSEEYNSNSFDSTLDDSLDCENENDSREEADICSELDSVQTLLKTVTQVTKQQRAEMTTNLAFLDKLDMEVKTKKAGINNLKCGRTNSIAAPRSLLKCSKERGKAVDKPTGFV